MACTPAIDSLTDRPHYFIYSFWCAIRYATLGSFTADLIMCQLFTWSVHCAYNWTSTSISTTCTKQQLSDIDAAEEVHHPTP